MSMLNALARIAEAAAATVAVAVVEAAAAVVAVVEALHHQIPPQPRSAPARIVVCPSSSEGTAAYSARQLSVHPAEAAAARLASAPAAIAITEAARCRHRAHAWILTRIIILCATSLGATSVVIFLAQFSSKVAIEYIHQLRGGGARNIYFSVKRYPHLGPSLLLRL